MVDGPNNLMHIYGFTKVLHNQGDGRQKKHLDIFIVKLIISKPFVFKWMMQIKFLILKPVKTMIGGIYIRN